MTGQSVLTGHRSTPYKGDRSVNRSIWRRLVLDAIAAGARCVDCGSDRNLEGDHELPVSRGGLSTSANLAIRCRRCNRRKGNRVTRYQLRMPWPLQPHEDAARERRAELPPTSTIGRDRNRALLGRADSAPASRGGVPTHRYPMSGAVSRHPTARIPGGIFRE